MTTQPTELKLSRTASVIHFYNRWVVRIAWALSLVAAGVTLAISGLLISDLVAREIAGAPLHAVFETVRASMVAVVFLALAYAEHTESHIRIQVLTERLRGRWLAVVRTIGLSIGLAVSIMFTIATFTRAVTSTQINEIVLGLFIFPVWPSRWIIVLGFALMSLVFIGKVATCIHTLIVGGDDLAKPARKLEEDI